MNLTDIRDQKVLVTGAGGFIGEVVCRILASDGADVYGIGRSMAPSGDPICSYQSIDLTDAKATIDYVSDLRPQFVIHLAGCSIAKRELEWVQKTFDANLLTTVNILSAAQLAGVAKTVIAGSLEQPDENSLESAPASPYAASKWAATGYARMFHSVYDLQVVTARIFMVYGPGQKELQKMIPYVCLSTIGGDAPELMSGTRLIDWVYIDDVAKGLVKMLLNGPGDGSLVDIGTGRLVSTRDVAELICMRSGTGLSPVIGAIADRAMEQTRKADIVQTKKLIGWRPEVVLEDGLDLTLAWYKQTYAAR